VTGSGPLVTVIVATYNCRQTLRWTLESIRRQDMADFEVRVVGDGCTDGSEEVVRELGDGRFLWSNLDRNTGSQAGPNNEGLRHARGKYAAYVGHDDVWMPWHLSSLAAAIRREKADLVYGLCALVGPQGPVECTGPPMPTAWAAGHFVPPSSWLHRVELREEIGPWPDADRLARGVDREYLRRIHHAGKRVVFEPRLTVLKFPSLWWGHYAGSAEPPQTAAALALREDPRAVEHRVLLDLSIQLARERYGEDRWIRPFRRSARLLFERLLRAWGHDRWPLPPLATWWHQRYRRRIRPLRGLPPK
jgi:glycosyltransferase involved in cell wall biosynthesis